MNEPPDPIDNDDDDASIFRQAIDGVQPLNQDKIEPYRRRRRPEPLALTPEDEAADDFADTGEEAPAFLEFQRPGIQHRLYQDLGRGLIPPQATLDLHGMRVVDARKALAIFLKRSLQSGFRCVRIIHGKGQRSENKQAVLKQRLNQWLKQKDAVLAFRSAPRWDGGTGAAYVLLSRKYID